MTRRPAIKRARVVVGAPVVAFVATTWWALESGGVAVIETRPPGGGVRSTHVWYVESDGELWLEAGSPENSWYRDVRENGAVGFEANGRSAQYIARPSDDASSHSWIRSQIRAKYGVRDRWVGLTVDTSRSVAVRLVPDPGESRRSVPAPGSQGDGSDS